VIAGAGSQGPVPFTFRNKESVVTGGRASRDKGNRTERAIVCLLQEHGLAAERVPLSGAARGRFGGDVSVPGMGRDLRGEVKVRANGFARLYEWLGDRDFLVLRADRCALLCVCTLEFASRVLKVAEDAKGDAKRIGELEYALANIRDENIPNGLEPDSYARAVLTSDGGRS
jgi:hypothetical protein